MGIANRMVLSAEHKAARVLAREKGEMRFLGDPCAHGHGRGRLTSHGGCVTCQRLRNAAKPKKPRPSSVARREAIESGSIFYDGKECVRHHGGRRYVSTRRCVECSRLFRCPNRKTKEQIAEEGRARRARPEIKARRSRMVAERYHSDPAFRVHRRMSSRIRKALAVHGYTKKGRSWVQIVGYSPDELRRHIERQFLKGMTWDNSHLWHIDHILPVKSFGAVEIGSEGFRACWALTNLRPLWKAANMEKGDRRMHLL